MRSKAILSRGGRALAGYARRHPLVCLGETILVLVLLVGLGAATTVADGSPSGVASQAVTDPSAAIEERDGSPVPPSWVWKRRVPRDGPVYAFGAH